MAINPTMIWIVRPASGAQNRGAIQEESRRQYGLNFQGKAGPGGQACELLQESPGNEYRSVLELQVGLAQCLPQSRTPACNPVLRIRETGQLAAPVRNLPETLFQSQLGTGPGFLTIELKEDSWMTDNR